MIFIKKNREEVNLLLCGNKKVFDGALTLLISILNKTNAIIHAYIFTMDVTRLKEEFVPITDRQINFLQDVISIKRPGSRITKVDVTELYEQVFRDSPNEKAYCTPYTLIRLLADMVPDMPDKLLYLDVDIMAKDDILKLYNIDIEEYEYAAVKEKYGCWVIRPDYINAGVLLMNLKKMKETNLLGKGREMLRKRKLLFADQDAIYWNTTKKKLLPRRFNEQSKINGKKNTVLVHFCKRLMFLPYPHTTNYKQWNIKKIHNEMHCHVFDTDLEEYLKLKEGFKDE